MPIELYKDEPAKIPVVFASNPLTPYGKDYNDIEHIYMGFKLNAEIDADDAYLQKLSTDNPVGVTLDGPNHTFTMDVLDTDYTNLVVGNIYELVLAIKVQGISKRVELKLADPTIQVVADKSRA